MKWIMTLSLMVMLSGCGTQYIQPPCPKQQVLKDIPTTKIKGNRAAYNLVGALRKQVRFYKEQAIKSNDLNLTDIKGDE